MNTRSLGGKKKKKKHWQGEKHHAMEKIWSRILNMGWKNKVQYPPAGSGIQAIQAI